MSFGPLQPPPVPQFTAGPGGPDSPGYGLAGWEAFDQWCQVNVASWCEFREYGTSIGASELDVTRAMAAYYFMETLALRQQQVERSLVSLDLHGTVIEPQEPGTTFLRLKPSERELILSLVEAGIASHEDLPPGDNIFRRKSAEMLPVFQSIKAKLETH